MQNLQSLHGRKISDPLGGVNLPKRLDREKIPELISRLKKGDPDAEKELIEGHMTLATYIVSKYYNEKHVDDYLGTAFITVVMAVKQAKTMLNDDNITPFIVTRVRGAILNLKQKQDRYERIDTYSLGGHIVNRTTPDEIVAVNELITKFREKADVLENIIFEKLYEGSYDAEIAREMNYSRKHIHSIHKKIKSKFHKLLHSKERGR